MWDYFLSNDQHFGSGNVVRLKILNSRGESEDEFMLVAKEQREFFAGQPYQLICIVLKCPTASRQNEHQLELKIYILMVSEYNRHPLPDVTSLVGSHSSRTRLESGEFANKAVAVDGSVLASSAPHPLTISEEERM